MLGRDSATGKRPSGRLKRARQAAEINITAARSFIRGLNPVYFALASLGWLIGPVPLSIATVLTAGVLLRRELASPSRQIMLEDLQSPRDL